MKRVPFRLYSDGVRIYAWRPGQAWLLLHAERGLLIWSPYSVYVGRDWLITHSRRYEVRVDWDGTISQGDYGTPILIRNKWFKTAEWQFDSPLSKKGPNIHMQKREVQYGG
jgi:hypothetical protein